MTVGACSAVVKHHQDRGEWAAST
jgi:hypothetical protein